MTSIDGDWVCDEEDLDDQRCYAVWQFCDRCDDGLVPIGKGIPVEPGNMYYDDRKELAARGLEICATCTGSGGGYACGYHDLNGER